MKLLSTADNHYFSFPPSTIASNMIIHFNLVTTKMKSALLLLACAAQALAVSYITVSNEAMCATASIHDYGQCYNIDGKLDGKATGGHMINWDTQNSEFTVIYFSGKDCSGKSNAFNFHLGWSCGCNFRSLPCGGTAKSWMVQKTSYGERRSYCGEPMYANKGKQNKLNYDNVCFRNPNNLVGAKGLCPDSCKY